MYEKHFRITLLTGLVGGLLLLPNAHGEKNVKTNPAGNFDRNQTLLLNLKSAPMSAGYYLLRSYGNTRVMSKDLEKALSQVAAVDKLYAKGRQRPDDRYLENVSLKITLARQTADSLQEQLQDAYEELKSSVTELVATDPNFKD